MFNHSRWYVVAVLMSSWVFSQGGGAGSYDTVKLKSIYMTSWVIWIVEQHPPSIITFLWVSNWLHGLSAANFQKIWQKKFHPLPLCKYIRSWVHQDKQLATPIFQVPINMNIYNSPRLAWPFETLLNIFGQHIVRTGLFEAYWTPPSQLSSYKCRTYISEYTTEY